MNKNLYKVESNVNWRGNFVFANGYDEAARKVFNHLYEEREEKERNMPLLNKDGDLNIYIDSDKKQEEIKITKVELIADVIIP